MNRREILAAFGISALAASIGLGPAASASAHVPTAEETEIRRSVVYRRGGIIFRLPKSSRRRIAWTIDDGTSVTMIRDYVQFAKKHNVRLTFFVYSAMSGWKTLAPVIKPMVATGQIQIANHTHHHPDLTTLSTSEIQRELWECHLFILKHYGVDARPFFRPPYGAVNSLVVKAAAAIGYTSPIMWSGTLADATRISTQGIWRNAKTYIGNEVILLSHANTTQTAALFNKILGLIRSKGLAMVTLNDAMAPRPLPPANVRATIRGSVVTVSWSRVTNAQFYDISFWESGVLKHVRAYGTSHAITVTQPNRIYQFHVASSVFGVLSAPSGLSNVVRSPAAPTTTP